MARGWGLGLLAYLASLAAAQMPAAAAEEAVSVRALLNNDGSGLLYVNSGTGAWSWEACSTNLASCVPFGSGREITTAGASPETVFRATSADGATGLSPVWHGNLAALGPPSVNGAIRANELVSPEIAKWSGGWDGDFDKTQLSVCATPTGKRCTSITDPRYTRQCQGGAVVLDSALAGYYLRVADSRYGPDTLFTLEGAVSPYGHRVWSATASTAVAVVGRIESARGPRKARCGPPPLVEASIDRNATASVRCGLGCHVVLIARQAGRRVRVTRKLPWSLGSGGLRTLRFSPQTLTQQLGPGRCHIIVRVDGTRLANRIVRLPARESQNAG